jgi:hypothetical protein
VLDNKVGFTRQDLHLEVPEFGINDIELVDHGSYRLVFLLVFIIKLPTSVEAD